MADFKEYLKFTDKIEYRDRQVLEISKINIDEDICNCGEIKLINGSKNCLSYLLTRITIVKLS